MVAINVKMNAEAEIVDIDAKLNTEADSQKIADLNTRKGELNTLIGEYGPII